MSVWCHRHYHGRRDGTAEDVAAHGPGVPVMSRYEPQPDGGVLCNDPAHGELCDCGATPDMDYERGLDL